MLPVALIFLSPMVWLKILLSKPRTCLTNAIRMALTRCLAFRNVPRDQILGSSAQQLMSRRTRCVLPVAKKLLTPKTLNSRDVSSRLELKRQQQKSDYDQRAKPLPSLSPQQMVRLQTEKNYQKLGIVKQPTAQPRSYTVVPQQSSANAPVRCQAPTRGPEGYVTRSGRISRPNPKFQDYVT